MSILDGIKDKALALMGNASGLLQRQTKVYDASKNKIVIAGFELDGVISAVLSSKTTTIAEQGIDSSYYTYYDLVEPQTLTVTILPTAKCHQVIKSLVKKQQQVKGWFSLSVTENGELINNYRSHILNLPEINMSNESQDRVYVFGVKEVSPNIQIIDQSSPTTTGLINDTEVKLQEELNSLNVSEN